jgi:uncharacterized protein YcbK (DUF882 family)
MADRNDEEILRAILEKGSEKAKKAAAEAIGNLPATPADPLPVQQAKTRKKRRKLKEVAGALGKQKFYYGPDGTIIDKDGTPAPPKIAEMLVKKDATANAIKKSLGIKPALSKTEHAIFEKNQQQVNSKIEQLGKMTERVIATNNLVVNRSGAVFTEFQSVLDNFATQNNMILDSLIKQNEDFEEKILELLTGVKAPTKSSGEKKTAPTPRKKTGGSKRAAAAPARRTAAPKQPATASRYQKRVAAMTPEQRDQHEQKVQERAQNIGTIRTKRNVAAVAGGAVAGAAVGGAAAYGAYKLFSGDNASEPKAPPKQPDIPKISTRELDDGGTARPELGEKKPAATGAAGGSLFQQQAPAPAQGGATSAPPAQQQQQGAAGTPSKTPGMTTIRTPGGKAFDVASPYAANFQGFVTELENSGYKIKSIGGYANRNIAGTGTKSYHSLGVAIDINPAQNPHLFDGRLVTDMPSNVGQMASKYGLGWGGAWRSSKDAMHFSMAKGEMGAVAIDRSGATPLPGAPAAPGSMLAGGAPQGTTTGGSAGAPGSMLGAPQQTASLGTGAGPAGTPQKSPDVGTAGAGAAPGEVVKVVQAGAGFNVVQLADGSTERRDGARNWRNNNPGNIQYGDFAKKYGALGSDGRFAIFPSYDAGRKAKESLLFEGKGYAGMNIQQAIFRYAPPNENNTQNYVATVAGAIGVPASTPLSQLNAQQRTAMLNAMEKVEGFKTGKVTKQGGAGGAPTTAVAAADAANQAAATAGAPQKAEAPTAVGAAGAANQAATAQMTGEKPSNVTFESGKVDLSKVDPKLLQGLYAAAKEYGKPVRINSAYRGDEYQAQLWVRGNILKEPGIHIPAKPSQTTTITYKGQTYTVPGSGKGSAHGRGQAMDINPGVGSDFQGILAKYGITYPFGGSDPPHIQLAGGSNYTAPAGGGEAAAGTAVASTPTAPTAVAGAALANASAAQAIQQGTQGGGIQTVVLNNTRTVNTTQVVRTGSSIPSRCDCGPSGFNPLAMAAGAALGKAMRLF